MRKDHPVLFDDSILQLKRRVFCFSKYALATVHDFGSQTFFYLLCNNIMARRLTMFSKLLIVFIILGAIGFGGKWVLDNTSFGKTLKEKAEQERLNRESDAEVSTSGDESSSQNNAKNIF